MNASHIQRLFDEWGRQQLSPESVQPWLLNRWEDVQGVDWPPEKVRLMLDHIQNGLRPEASGLVVEIGCGNGWILKALKTPSLRVAGLDISLAMLRLARLFLPQDFLVGAEMARLPFRSGSLERVLCYFVFLNNEDDDYLQQTLREIYRVMKSNGRALIGQLPDKKLSQDYDQAKKDYERYCRKNFSLGPDFRSRQRFPVRLFDRSRLARFLTAQGISYRFTNSFNPFYYPGRPETVPWRFDIILQKR